MKYNNNDDLFWPREVKFIDLLITSAWWFISWVIWSVILLFAVVVMSWVVDLPLEWDKVLWFWSKNPVFPFVLSIIILIVWTIVMSLNYFFLSMTDSDKYKKTLIHFGQISFFWIIIYLIFAPIYIYAWNLKYEYIMYVFIIHILILSFWVNLLLEILNNYRYILIWFYGNFIWLISSWMIVFYIFSIFSNWYAKLISLLFIIPLITWLILFFKWIFEIIYYNYFKLSGNDSLWDIFKKIEEEEEESLKQAINENSTY